MTDLELDALVAEKVMGLQLCKCWFCLNTGPKGECEDCGKVRAAEYSTDPAAADLLLRKLRDDGFWVFLSLPGGSNLVSCLIIDGNARPYGPSEVWEHVAEELKWARKAPSLWPKAHPPAIAIALNAEMAICMAALEFKGVKVPIEGSPG